MHFCGAGAHRIFGKVVQLHLNRACRTNGSLDMSSPAELKMEPPADPDSGTVDKMDSTRPTVLIIDDDPTARLALAAMVTPDEYRLSFASDAADARARMAQVNPDVILCDLVMKDMCGDELFRWLQSHPEWSLVPVICVTRIDSVVVRADLLRAGADAVLVKPCNGSELRATVQAALRTRRKYLRIQRDRDA